LNKKINRDIILTTRW